MRLPPFQRHSDTSRQAAIAIIEHTSTLRARTYRFIKSRGTHGATDEEIITASGMAPNTIRPRRVELSQPYKDQPPLVEDSRRRRNTSSGRLAIVWVAL